MNPKILLTFSLVLLWLSKAGAETAKVNVEVEEVVYSYEQANNGAGPLWDHGSTNIVRIGTKVFVSGLDTIKQFVPLNNTQCRMWVREGEMWKSFSLAETGFTREPCPIIAVPSRNKVFLSANPTLNPPNTFGGGRSEPKVLEIQLQDSGFKKVVEYPRWRTEAASTFNEHSYRTFAADSTNNQIILLQNVGLDGAEWSFRDSRDHWVASGYLRWPIDVSVGAGLALRIAYPNVFLDKNSFLFVGVSDVQEPNEEWKRYKQMKTGRSWDYVFRHLFLTSTSDILSEKMADWVELANRESTAGRIQLGDLFKDVDGNFHLVWEEQITDLRLRDHFFPKLRQRWELNYAVWKNGKVIARHTLDAIDEGVDGFAPRLPRLHQTEDGKLFVFYYAQSILESSTKKSHNRILRIDKEGLIGSPILIPLDKPLNFYMTANQRTGSSASKYIDILGNGRDDVGVVRYVRLRIE